VAAIGNGAAFRRGRDFAAWVGVVPRPHSTGGKPKLYGIRQRGNVDLRRLWIHGARSVRFRVQYDTGGFGQWVRRLAQKRRCAWQAQNAFHFSTATTTDVRKSSTKVC
jgi:transposase